MRLNKFVAQATGLSRRSVDHAIESGRIRVNGKAPSLGQAVTPADIVSLDNHPITLPGKTQTIMLNKPRGYVCSRNGQGSKTIYDLLPAHYHKLKPVGRLDKDSSGLLVLTNDGELANKLTHPRYGKQKIYEVTLDKVLAKPDKTRIEQGLELEDGLSALQLVGQSKDWKITMTEGRNRQIRRTFEALGYRVTKLHRTDFGPYVLGTLPKGKYSTLG